MRCEYKLENPGEAEATMTITMTVNKWAELEEQLADEYPSWQFSNCIRALLRKANKYFEESEEVTG